MNPVQIMTLARGLCMTPMTEQWRWLVLGWILLLGLWFASAVWAEDTPPPGVRPETISAGCITPAG